MYGIKNKEFTISFRTDEDGKNKIQALLDKINSADEQR